MICPMVNGCIGNNNIRSKNTNKPRFIKTLESKAPAGAGALSFASMPAVYIGTNPSLAVNPVKMKMKASLSQKGFNLGSLYQQVIKRKVICDLRWVKKDLKIEFR